MAENKLEDVEGAVEEGKDKLVGNSNSDLKKRLIVPAAAGLGSLAATYAVRKAPDLLGGVKPKLEQQGGEEVAKVGKRAAEELPGEGGPIGKVASVAGKLGGGGSSGKTRRLPIQRWTDVAAPIDVVYQRWTEFDEFPKFMHRVLNVEKEDRNKVSWEEKIWFSRRRWEGEITERRKNDRIAWKTTKGTSHTGVITFHKLDTHLTRVMLDIDFHPSGMIEKMASGLRFVKRAVEADLARFKAYVELGEAKGLDYGHDVEDEDSDQSKSQSGPDDEESREPRREERARA
ncbi:MAG: SRPBCC family protein [Actinobacteria bacterium]|nr:MAG: SRPBCC family protein [Actinomycetota bacterium]